MFLQCLCSSNHRTNHGHCWIFYTSTGFQKAAQVHSAILHYLSSGALCPVQPRCCTSRNVKDSSKKRGGGGFHAGRNELCVDSKNQVPNITQLPPRVPNELPMKRYQVPIRRLINHHQLAPVVSLTFLASNQSLPTSSNTWGSHQQWYWCFNKNGEAPN